MQPAFGSDFRTVFYTPLNRLRGGVLGTEGPDSLRLTPGLDFLPDARSDSGRVAFDMFSIGSLRAVSSVPNLGSAVILSSPAERADLVRLRDLGARIVLILGDLTIRESTRPVTGLVIVNLQWAAAERLTGIEEGRLRGLSRGVEVDEMILNRTVVARVSSEAVQRVGSLNVSAFRAGRNPMLSSRLVIVAVDMDGLPWLTGTRIGGIESTGIAPAAVLEVARAMGRGTAVVPAPDMTVMFKFLSGGWVENAGLNAYLNQPVWPLDATEAVIYVGLTEERRESVEEMLALHGVRLVVIPIEGDLPEWGYGPFAIPQEGLVAAGRSSTQRAPAIQTSYIAAAQLIAPPLADRILEALLREASLSGPLTRDATLVQSPLR
jgi:hypothetical protein